jgi:hypothetical protein
MSVCINDTPLGRREPTTRINSSHDDGRDTGNAFSRRPALGEKMNDDRYKQRMYSSMKQHTHVPLDGRVRSSVWINNEFAVVRSNDPYFRNVYDLINSEIRHMSLHDLKAFWESKGKSVFYE